MLKEAIEKILEIAPFQTVEIGGDTYSDRRLVRVEPHVDRPAEITVNSLDSVAQLVKQEWDGDTMVFIQVETPHAVKVFTTYGERYLRSELYRAEYDGPVFQGGFREQQQAIIELRSRFIPNEGSEYLLGLLSRISQESTVASSDNGVTQTVEAKQGIALAAKVPVKPRVVLQPYRTFQEVEQPASEFLLRLDGEGHVGLFEADGGMWKLEAKARIKAYLEGALADMEHKAIVMM